jgi:hypothetical protein
VLAHRLSREVGAIDAEKLIDLEVFENWRAYYRVEPWGGERELLARIAALLQMLVWKEHARDTHKADKCVDSLVQSMMPDDWIGQPEAKHSSTDSVEQFESFVSGKFG